jgi:dTDP-4-amino-4,6-dideoxygalactose transaminase
MEISYENLSKVNLNFFKEFKKNINKFLYSNEYILGKNIKKFEKNFSKFNNSKYCVGVNSGLDALVLSLESLNLKKNSKIFVASNTYIATILAIIRAGYKPILIEPDINTYNISFNEIKKNFTKDIKAIIVTHLYGLPCYI